jgi:hypothetical protein
MKTTFVILLLLIACYSPQFGYRNVDAIKAASTKTWEEAGFKVAGYEGYLWGFQGGDVCYILNRPATPGVTYHGCLCKWGEEYHIYNLRAIDAIKPTP